MPESALALLTTFDGPAGGMDLWNAVIAFGIFFTVLICVAVALGALLAHGYLRQEGLESSAFFVLMMLSASGGILMAKANDLILIFLGLEILSIALYVLAGYHQRREQSREAARPIGELRVRERPPAGTDRVAIRRAHGGMVDRVRKQEDHRRVAHASDTQQPGDDVALDVGCPGVDDTADRISQIALDSRLAEIAFTSMDAYCVHA